MLKIDKNITENFGYLIKRLRQEKKITQKQLSKEIGISVAYLNLIENNKRTVTGKIIKEISKVCNTDLSEFTTDYHKKLNLDLKKIFSDSIFENHEVKTTGMRDLFLYSPSLGDAVRTLYEKYSQKSKDVAKLSEQIIEIKQEISGSSSVEQNSADIISDMLQKNRNYFADLEKVADLQQTYIDLSLGSRMRSLVEYLQKKFNIRVDFLDNGFQENFVKKYDAEKKVLKISNTLSRESKEFLISHQIGLLAAKEIIEAQLKKENILHNNTLALGRTVLANYFASCLIMPYDKFWKLAEDVKYDIDILSNRFDASFEQIAHRLTTLQKKNKEGIPFHFMRVDIAGNVSKKFSISGLKIPRYSVACPRWNVYTAFLNPGKIKFQLSKMLDGQTFFCLARTVSKRIGNFSSPETFFSIGLGFDIKFAEKCVYSKNFDLHKAIPTGISCRTCERKNCRQRAFPPMHKSIKFDENIRGFSGYISPDN